MPNLTEVDDAADAARYIGNYLDTQSYRVRKIVSAGWVFPGWIGFSQWFKKELGACPPRRMLIGPGRMRREEHKGDT